jgi:glutathione S-transferase
MIRQMGEAMSQKFTIYGDKISGNCLKVEWVADYLRLPVIWKDVHVMNGETRTAEFLSLNPLGKVPFVVRDDGATLAESNAIIYHFAEGSELIPEDPLQRACMLQWMFWEQYSHEPYIAVRRFLLTYLKRPVEELDTRLLEQGNKALSIMEGHLRKSQYFVSECLTLADIALFAYTRVAHEGGFSLDERPAVNNWIERVEDELNIKTNSSNMSGDDSGAPSSQ